MPAALWAEAVRAARSCGIYAIARAVDVDYGALAKRVAEDPGAGPDDSESSAVRFVEWTGAQLQGVPAATGSVVELSDGSGRQMTVRLNGGQELDVVGLVSAFCGSRA
jgi:hypothetical protein